MKKNAVIVAGGAGTRLGSELPKQFLDLCGRPMLWWSIKAFHDEDPLTRIIVVMNAGFLDLWKDLNGKLLPEERIPHELMLGGSTRTESVKNGLAAISAMPGELVAVHDAARPLVSADMIAAGWREAEKSGAAIPAVAVTDSLRRVFSDGSEAVDRSGYVAVQTPQVFSSSMLKSAYDSVPGGVFTDDASAIEAAGGKVALYKGSHDNMKVTNPGDLEIAALLLKQREACGNT
ncbi:MAG: 2-C-methyl-D-erythritol 4-phosphate cytidylyltransferase [Muribaculaceae bacterium]|jgi:2-C-methyl-D-erythritol 4-phosphate cytidylyltransferase